MHLARKKDTGYLCAIKSISKAFIKHEKARLDQVHTELACMRKLGTHPFILKLQYAFESKDYLHLVVDFCSGGELFYLL